MPRAAHLALLAAILAAAGFSLYIAGSPLLACGRDLAGIEIYAWLALSAVQGILFMLGGISERALRAYRVLQLLMLPLLGVVTAQLATAFPRFFVAMMLFAAIYWALVAAPAVLRGRRLETTAFEPGAVVTQTTIFLLALLVVHSAIAFAALHVPGMRLSDRTFWCIAVASAVLCAVLVRDGTRSMALSITGVPPLALLALALLRAKLPDGSYDALLYKTTIPIMIADWRTALTGVFDHTLLGTNFGEIMSSQLRILDPEYPPALSSSLAFAALWVVAPLAARGVFRGRLEVPGDHAWRAAVLLMVSITEPLLAAGTSYHEPLMSLLMAAFLLPMSAGWLFLGAAIATKASVVFIAPLLLALKALSVDVGGTTQRPALAAWSSPLGRHALARPVLLTLCLVLGAAILGEQLARNLAVTDRILGWTDTLASVTDPGNQVLAPAKVRATGPPRPYHEWVGWTLVHAATLDRWVEPTVWDFHVLPSSRLVVAATAVAACLLVFASLRRWRIALALSGVWVLCALAMFSVVTQGRHLSPLSFGAALLVAYAAALAMREAGEARAKGTQVAFAAAIALAASGDQVVGNFVNVGWDCRRSLETAVTASGTDRPQTALEQRLAQIVAQYRAAAPRGGFPPSIVCETETERKRYLGTHHVYVRYSIELVTRFLAANPGAAGRIPTSVLAVCFRDPAFADEVLPARIRQEFTEVEGADGVRVLVSTPLMAGAGATSLSAMRMGARAQDRSGAHTRELVAEWNRARMLDARPADAPGGKGAFLMQVESRPTAVLLSPYRVSFDEITYRKGDRFVLEIAMPHSNSDGMALQLVIEDPAGARESFVLELAPKPANAAGPVWQSREVAVPERFAGPGMLTVGALSPSGDMAADWAYIRRLALVPRR